MQPHYNLIHREEERETIPLCRDQGVGVVPWSPLARGRLTRNWAEKTRRSDDDEFARFLYQRQTEEADRTVAERVAEIATGRGVSRAQIALAWVASAPGITAPIVGATKAHHLEDAVSALTLRLEPEELVLLEEPYVPHPIEGFGVRYLRSA
jgi:aryl-alcohol dehydrogenase (NADP+)